jgi:hypothetical protein
MGTHGCRVRLAFLAIAAVVALPVSAHAAAPTIGFDKPVFVDQDLAGGEPLIFADNKHGTIIYSSHEGTTHLYRPGFTAPLGDVNFVGNYRNQVNIWTSKDGGKTWQRTVFNQTGFATDPTKNTGFSDPDLTQDEGGRVYDTGINLANDALFSSNDGGFTWDKGNIDCHDGDRPWLAGAKKDEVFMAADGNTSGHVIVRSGDGGDNCETTEIPDNADSRNGYGKLYYDHNTEQLMEPELYFGQSGGVNAIGLATWSRGDKEFTPHMISNTTLFGHFPSIAIDAADNIYLTWDTDERDPNGTGGCNGNPTPLPNKIQMAVSKDHGITWTVRTVAAPSNARVMWPWMVAGDAGKVSVAWYQTDKITDPDCAGGDATQPTYSLMDAQIFDATNPDSPATVVDAAGRPISTGGVCQGGTTCVATGQDRRLGDYFTTGLDQRGCLIIASGDTTMKDPATGNELPTSRPIFIRQSSGEPLYTGTGTGDCSGNRGATLGQADSSVVPVGGASCTDTRAPYSRYARHEPRFKHGRPNSIFGTATDRGCRGKVTRVQVSVAQRVGPKRSQCRFLSKRGKLGRTTACGRHRWLSARGTSKWKLTLKKGLPAGYYKVWVRALDAHKHVEHVSRQNVRTFRVA